MTGTRVAVFCITQRLLFFFSFWPCHFLQKCSMPFESLVAFHCQLAIDFSPFILKNANKWLGGGVLYFVLFFSLPLSAVAPSLYPRLHSLRFQAPWSENSWCKIPERNDSWIEVSFITVYHCTGCFIISDCFQSLPVPDLDIDLERSHVCVGITQCTGFDTIWVSQIYPLWTLELISLS